ncbi:MAG: GTP-binding protein [Planctomycetota bacterium]
MTGFLGAGKTTLLNRWLSEPRGERLAVIVNEFGDLGIDGGLIVAADEEVVELANGCVCCTVRGDLVTALHGLLDRRRRRFRATPIERLAIETSGLASPGPILQTLLLEERLAAELVPASVVTLAHARHVLRQVEEHPEVAEQLGYADAILLNHADEVTDGERERTRLELARRSPLARIHVVEHAASPVELRDIEPGALPSEMSGAHGHTEGAMAIALVSDTPLELHRLKMWLQLIERDPSGTIWRVKGRLACREVSEEVIVQGVYQTLEIGPGKPVPPARSELVVLGRNLDEAALRRGWEHCRARENA